MDQEFEKRLLRQQNGQSFLSPSCSPLSPPFAKRNQPRSLPPSPGVSTPSKDRHGDRFIPCRAGAKWHIDFDAICESDLQQENKKDNHQQLLVKRTKKIKESGKDTLMYQCLLKNELLGAEIERTEELEERRILRSPYTENRNIFKYSVRRKRLDYAESARYSSSPIGVKSQRLLQSPRNPMHKIPQLPYKVLDAPELEDDFYLNLVDWSSTNLVCVGLASRVYLWSAHTSEVTKLCDLAEDDGDDFVTSVNWNERGNLVAVGTNKGHVQIWDVICGKRSTLLEGHSDRIGALAWNGDQLSSGGRDRLILQQDIRSTSGINVDRTLTGHTHEVCGLKWSPDRQYLASGGNDNALMVWSAASNGGHSSVDVKPMQTYSKHTAAVKAIAWSPHQHGLLASGGGTADRCIRIWNTMSQNPNPLHCMNTDSQVCNLAWSRHANELVSTHGYSENEIVLWKYPSLVQTAKLTGHTCRVLYLAFSPNGEDIVTGAGDETLRFWNVFSSRTSSRDSTSALNLFAKIR